LTNEIKSIATEGNQLTGEDRADYIYWHTRELGKQVSQNTKMVGAGVLIDTKLGEKGENGDGKYGAGTATVKHVKQLWDSNKEKELRKSCHGDNELFQQKKVDAIVQRESADRKEADPSFKVTPEYLRQTKKDVQNNLNQPNKKDG